MQTILAIDDEAGVRRSYSLILNPDYHVLLAESGAAGLEMLDTKHVDLVLLDLKMPGLTGEEVLRKLQVEGNTVPIVVVTASNTVTSAVEAMKLGATDYVIKPFDVENLRTIIARILADERARRELQALRAAELKGFESMIGTSEAFHRVLLDAQKAMAVDTTVLITGESGTGKDLIARAIHAGGPRKEKPFVAISCCAIPDNLVESELFGHEKGAFTGADSKTIGKLQVADGGTVFLDEIGEMPIQAQVKLLRVLQNNSFFPVGSTKEIEVDLRVICATNRNLMEAIRDGIFREDLYYRLNVLNIQMPSLRQRREDVPELVSHFVVKHGPRVNSKVQEISPKALAKLSAYDWPGNIRELENTVQRLLVHYGQERVLTGEHAAAMLPKLSPEMEDAPTEIFDGLPLEEAIRRVEAQLIRRALERSNFVQSRAAELLGTTRRILKYKMDQLDLNVN